MAANNLDHFLPRRYVKKYASGIFLASVLLLLHSNRINAGRSDFYICQKRAMPFFDKLKSPPEEPEGFHQNETTSFFGFSVAWMSETYSTEPSP